MKLIEAQYFVVLCLMILDGIPEIIIKNTSKQMEGQAPTQAPREEGGRGGRGFGRGGDRGGRGGRGGDRGGRGGRGGPGGGKDDWTPKTKLGRLVKNRYITTLEEIYTHSIPIKESPIVDMLIKESKASLSDEVMKIVSVQKQTKAGQRTRFKAIVVIGDQNGHVGLGIKLSKEVQISIKGALIAAKLSLVPVRRGYWGNRIGNVHTVPAKSTGKGGSVRFKLTPAPRGTGIVAAPIPKKILQFAGIDDVYTASSGSTRTSENFIKACFDAIANTYKFLSPDLWTRTENIQSPLTKHAEWLEAASKKSSGPRPERGDRRGGRGRGFGRGRGEGGRGRGGDRGGERREGGERRPPRQQPAAAE